MAVKSVNGKCRVVLVLPEEECRAYEREAEQTGIAVNDVLRMKLRGFRTIRTEAA
jgi:hypothetical protein